MSVSIAAVLAQLDILYSDRRAHAEAILHTLTLPDGSLRIVNRSELAAAFARVGSPATAPELAGEGATYVAIGRDDTTSFDDTVMIEASAEVDVLWSLLNQQHVNQSGA